MCGLFESWILYDVTFLEEVRGCAETLPAEWGLRVQLVEIIWSYFLPVILITVLDFRVLCCHSVWRTRGPLSIADSDPQSENLRRPHVSAILLLGLIKFGWHSLLGKLPIDETSTKNEYLADWN
jgi:hypothetical protein